MRVAFARLHPEARMPERMTREAAGLDLAACLGKGERIELPPGGRALVPTGLQLRLPPGHEGQVRPRSGLALRHGVTVLNAPGTIDADYRGELGVLLVNLGVEPFVIHHGDRVAQLVVVPVAMPELVEIAAFGAEGGAHEGPPTSPSEPSGTDRGAGGYGSTGGFGPDGGAP
jgi:dUTP pyrophosphatase